MKEYTLTETAKAIRQVLKATFPRTKFSVRSESYSMGCAITASWTDGPNQRMVQRILDLFENRGFDGMTDSSYSMPDSIWNGEACRFGANYVHGSRQESAALRQVAAYNVHKFTKLPLLEIATDKWNEVIGGSYKVPFEFRWNDNDTPRLIETPAGDGEEYKQLVYQVARCTPTEFPTPDVALPAYTEDKHGRRRPEPMPRAVGMVQ